VPSAGRLNPLKFVRNRYGCSIWAGPVGEGPVRSAVRVVETVDELKCCELAVGGVNVAMDAVPAGALRLRGVHT
jgi:hypothetical protein